MNLDFYTAGLSLVFQMDVMLMLMLGVISGIIIGCMPGLSATMAVAVLTPLTFSLDTTQAFALLIGTYCSAVFGGSISAILVNIPGTPSAVMTTLDGHPMAQRGEAGSAIGLAIVSSLIGGLFSVLILMLLAPPIAELALKFSAEEYFALAIFGVSMMAYVSGKSLIKGLIAGALGLLLATIGSDPGSGILRYTFGNVNLITGVDIIPVLIGLFGLTEVLINVSKCGIKKKVEQRIGKILPSFKVIREHAGTLLRSSVLGVVVGAAPAAGGTIASIMAYGLEKRLSKHPEKFGTGIPEGLMAPESANNASTGGAMIPLLTLGIPGDAVTAVLIGALMIHGLQPGPLLFTNNPKFVSSIFILMALANIAFFFVASIGTKPISKMLNISDSLLYPIIGLLCIIGTYASRGLLFDVGVLIICGILGYLMSKVGIPTAPLVLGLILGPIVEKNLTRTMIISNGSLTSLFTRPISLIFMLLTLFVLFGPVIQKLIKKTIKSENQ